MDYKESLKNLIKLYFLNKVSGSAKEIHVKVGKNHSYSLICQILHEMELEGLLSSKIVSSTKFVRAHYVYFKKDLKKEPFWKRLLVYLRLLF